MTITGIAKIEPIRADNPAPQIPNNLISGTMLIASPKILARVK